MTIPEDVRRTIGEVLAAASKAITKYGGTATGRETLARIDAALAWLDAQPVAPECWEPVEDAEITLPDDLRICRRVEVTE